MTPELQAYAEQDKGYFQFCQRYDLVSADPETRQKYHKWTLLQMKEWVIRQTAIEDGRE